MAWLLVEEELISASHRSKWSGVPSVVCRLPTGGN